MYELLLQYFDKNIVDEVLKATKYHRLLSVNKSKNAIKKSINLDLCKKLYIEYKMPIYKIAMLYGVSDATIRNYFIKYNAVKLKGHKCGRNSDNNYFETIDSPDKAYFLGLITADGSIQIGDKECKKIFSIELSEYDGYILEKLNKYANFNTKLITSHKNDKHPRKRLAINSEKIFNDLINLGIKRNKTYLGTSIPNIPENLIPHFIRGYFDGDGIAFSKGYIGFCGDENIVTQIRDYLYSKGMKKALVWFNKSNHIYYVQWSSKEDRKKFIDIIYRDKQDLFLERKYERIVNGLR